MNRAMSNQRIPFDVVACPQDERREALELLFAGGAATSNDIVERGQRIERLLANEQSVGLEGLFVARQEGRLIGATWAQPQPGNVAMVWPARLISDAPTANCGATAGRDTAKTPAAGLSESVALALMTRIDAFLTEKAVRVAQSLLSNEQSVEAERLAMAGLTYATDLLYLVAGTAQFPREAPATGLNFVTLDQVGRARLMAVVERTYHETLDCPQLNGVRSIDEVLAGYQAAGQFSPRRWLLARQSGALDQADGNEPLGAAALDDVGCLLLADHPEHGQFEIIYMGIVPEARGREVGQRICQWAEWLTREAGREWLVAAVDAANRPAVAMYAAAGFSIVERRSVFLRIL